MEDSDVLITILFTLFVASTVNERIIDFIKVQFPILWMKSFNFNDEIKRKRRLWFLAFGMGIISARILEINIVELYHEANLATAASSEGADSCCEIIFTAVFISLGSKFWHDLLDLTLNVKRAKMKIHNFDPKTVTEVEDIDSYLQENEFKLAKKALETHRKRLTKTYGENATIEVGYEHVENQYRVCIQVFDRNKSSNSEPDDEHTGTMITQLGKNIVKELEHLFGKIKRVSYTTDYGYVFRFPVVVYHTGKVVTTNSDKAEAGGGIFNKESKENVGTFGCIVKKMEEGCDDIFLLTCYHCVKLKDEHDWKEYDTSSKKGIIHYKPYLDSHKIKPIGIIEKAYRDNAMDIALIKPKKPEDITDYHWNFNRTVPIHSDVITDLDCQNRRKVWFSGVRSGASKGYIINHNFPVEIDYGDDKHSLFNLIVFSKNKSKPYKNPCDEGDSGAILIDAETHQALGMIVAKDDNFGYAIPIGGILKLHGLGLYLDPCIINSLELQNTSTT